MPEPRDRAKVVLVASVVLTIALYVIPWGWYLAYPLILLSTVPLPLILVSTVPHGMGHGVAALLVGGKWHSFRMWSTASGVAFVSSPLGIRSALVSAGGLVGPAIAAGLGFFFARREKTARIFFAV